VAIKKRDGKTAEWGEGTRTNAYFKQIARDLSRIGLNGDEAWKVYDSVGWTKLKEIGPHLKRSNWRKWVKFAIENKAEVVKAATSLPDPVPGANRLLTLAPIEFVALRSAGQCHHMAEERAQRRLAAILSADVVGYSLLMELDRRRTLVLLSERRHKMLYPLVAVHHDRIVKLLGWRSQRTPAPF
jgi:hypothetical protein